ncbi:TRAP-type C4-dicarboxylate transport system permease small subunit [Hymenobacter sp. UYAg731]
MITLRENAARAQQTITMFQGLLVVLSLVILADFGYLNLLGNGRGTDEIDATPLGITHNLLAVVELIVLITSFVLFVRWLRRAYWNLHALGRPTEHSEGWAAGAWFVPFLNMFRPYSIVREVWRQTQLVAFEQVTPHGLLRAWWLLFIAHSIVSNVTSRMENHATTTEQLQSAVWGNAITAMLMLGTAVLTIQVVRRIAGYEAQMDLRLQVSRIGAAAPQPAAELLEDQSDYEY